MEKILFNGNTETGDKVKITYSIDDGVLTMVQQTSIKKDKRKLFKQEDYENEIKLTIDKYFTKKLFQTITEEELKEKFGKEDGFIDFQNYCEKKKIEMHFNMVLN